MPNPVELPQPLELEVRASLGDWAGQWDALVASQPLPTPFLASWWLDNTHSGDLVVLIAHHDGELLGGAAFERDLLGRGPARIERIRSVGQGVLAPDHLDLIATPARHLDVARAVVEWLRRPGHRIVDLDGLAADGTLGTVLEPFTLERCAAPFAAIDGDSATYLAGRPGRVRSTIKRTRRRLERDGVTYVGTDLVDEPEALDRLAELHGSRWQDTSDFLDGWARFRSAALAGAAAGEVRLHELVAEDGTGTRSTIAAEIDLTVGDRYYFYQAGRRTEHEWRGAGSVLRADIIGGVEDLAEYDLLRGDESYKAEWSTGERWLLRCRFGIGIGATVLAAHRVRVVAQERLAERRGSAS